MANGCVCQVSSVIDSQENGHYHSDSIKIIHSCQYHIGVRLTRNDTKGNPANSAQTRRARGIAPDKSRQDTNTNLQYTAESVSADRARIGKTMRPRSQAVQLPDYAGQMMTATRAKVSPNGTQLQQTPILVPSELCKTKPQVRDNSTGLVHKCSSRPCAPAAASSNAGALEDHRTSVETVAAVPPINISRSPSTTSTDDTMDGTIYFYERDMPYFGFTNFSDHLVEYKNKKYPTSEHLFQAYKFLKNRPEVAEDVRRASTARAAFDMAHQHQQDVRADWCDVNIRKMDKVLSLKFQQHPDLREELLSTGNACLVENSPYDRFWGNGPDRKGANELGKALMRLRDQLREL